MFISSLFPFVALLLAAAHAWPCLSDVDCADLSGGVCADGVCRCPTGQQAVGGGTVCDDVPLYYMSPCTEDFQCARLVTGFQCRRGDNSTGVCACQPTHHYYLGRCWPTVPLGATCVTSQQCRDDVILPSSVECVGVCACAEGHYLRQRGECRQRGDAIGDRCVIDGDCFNENGACDRATLTCYDSTVGPQTATEITISTQNGGTSESKMAATRQHGVACDVTCGEPFECSDIGICVCPRGYYVSDDETTCFAELGSPATEDTCAGFLAEVRDGVCVCAPNFFYEENMRDCVKALIRVTDACVSDAQCHTFGAAAHCSAPQPPWGARSCACDDGAVWDASRDMCRLVAGIGEPCEQDSDCQAGAMQIVCAAQEQGSGVCACPDGLQAEGGLCLTAGQQLGDACQVTAECATPHGACAGGVCTCGEGYTQRGDQCAPLIGGACALDSECATENTVCETETATCRCSDHYVEYDNYCWEVSPGYNNSCEVPAQCGAALGAGSLCENGYCACAPTHHYRDTGCWMRTGLFEPCSRTSECYLPASPERVVCRNGACQCRFEYPYSEANDSCQSHASSVVGSATLLISSICYLIYNFS